jgi:hypothetical protein
LMDKYRLKHSLRMQLGPAAITKCNLNRIYRQQTTKSVSNSLITPKLILKGIVRSINTRMLVSDSCLQRIARRLLRNQEEAIKYVDRPSLSRVLAAPTKTWQTSAQSRPRKQHSYLIRTQCNPFFSPRVSLATVRRQIKMALATC